MFDLFESSLRCGDQQYETQDVISPTPVPRDAWDLTRLEPTPREILPGVYQTCGWDMMGLCLAQRFSEICIVTFQYPPTPDGLFKGMPQFLQSFRPKQRPETIWNHTTPHPHPHIIHIFTNKTQTSQTKSRVNGSVSSALMTCLKNDPNLIRERKYLKMYTFSWHLKK